MITKNKNKLLKITCLLATIFVATPNFAEDNRYEAYHRQQDYARKLSDQARDDYERQMINCSKNSVFSNSCAENAKKEYIQRRNSAYKIYYESKTNERQMRRDDYNRRQNERELQYREKHYGDEQRRYQRQQDFLQRQFNRQQRSMQKDAERQSRYMRKRQQQQDFHNRQQSKRAERDRRMDNYQNSRR